MLAEFTNGYKPVAAADMWRALEPEKAPLDVVPMSEAIVVEAAADVVEIFAEEDYVEDILEINK